MKRILIDLQSLYRRGVPVRFQDIKPHPGHVVKPEDIDDLNFAVEDYLACFYGSNRLVPFYRHAEVPHWLPKNYMFGGEVGDALYQEVRSWNENIASTMAQAIHLQKTAGSSPWAKDYIHACAHMYADYPVPESSQFIISGPCMVTSYLRPDMLKDIRNNPSRYALLTIQTPMLYTAVNMSCCAG